MPDWVNIGFFEYVKRLPKDYQLNLIAINATKRSKSSDITRVIEQESQELLSKSSPRSRIIALDEHGKELNTLELARNLKIWHDDNQDISLFIGGPDGLSKELLSKADFIWSLSKLTLPHPLVRVIAAEQIYRAWSIINQHPYHRG